jgi:hypothetical protein
MATSRRSLISVFVILLTVGAAAALSAAPRSGAPSVTANPDAVSARALTATPPVAHEIRAADGQSDADPGRRLPNAFGFVDLTVFAIALAAGFVHQQKHHGIPVLALAFAHRGPRAPPASFAIPR